MVIFQSETDKRFAARGPRVLSLSLSLSRVQPGAVGRYSSRVYRINVIHDSKNTRIYIYLRACIIACMRGSRGGTPASQLGGINFELSSVEREASRAGSLRGRRIQRIATQWRRRAGPPLLRRQPLSSAEETRTSRGKGREIRDAEQRRGEGSKSGWAE